MGGGMTADANGTANGPGTLRRSLQRLRSRTAAVERVLALGTVTLIIRAFLGAILTIDVYPALLGGMHLGAGVGAEILWALLTEVSLVLVLPLVAWALGWVFEGSPMAIGIGAAYFAEFFGLFIVYLSQGLGALVDHPAYLGTRLLVTFGAGLLAAYAFRDARRRADAREQSHRRIAPEADAPPKDDPPKGDVRGDGTADGSSGSGTS